MKTSELIGAALDWAVAKCEGHEVQINGQKIECSHPGQWLFTAHFSTNWAQGGPIIERENICLRGEKPGFTAWVHQSRATIQGGSTQLIAAMRCYVASKLGDEVDIPEELRVPHL